MIIFPKNLVALFHNKKEGEMEPNPTTSLMDDEGRVQGCAVTQ